MIIEVKNCKNCPFAEYHLQTETQDEFAICIAPTQIHENYTIDSYYKNYKSPKWCPLKKQELTIKFKQ